MLKRFFICLYAIVALTIPGLKAQPGDPCDPVLVADVQGQLIGQGFDCLQGAGPFACIDDVFNYALENCPPPVDTTNWGDPCDPAVVADLQNQLIDQGFSCLAGAGPFACVDDVFNYAHQNCPPPFDTTGWNNPCDPVFVADVQNQLIAQGFGCLDGAGPFACVNDVVNFAIENCPPPIDTTGWGHHCDSAVVADVQNQLIAQGYDCLAGAGPFACIDDVFNYAHQNCPLPIDTTGWGNPCDSAYVADVQNQLIAQGFDCLAGAGPFACVDEVINFALQNCPPPNDTTGWGNPCDSAYVADVQNQLIAQGFNCLDGAGPFACVDEVINYALQNCPPPNDTTGWGNPCDPAYVADVQNQLIAQGFDCLVGAGPFACIDEVVNFAFENCPPPVDTSDCDPVAVADLQAQLIDEGYDCLIGAGPFACEHDVLCYAMSNCPPDPDTTFMDVPACFLNIPQDVVTFQQFLLYIVANCDSSVTAGISPCWLNAPVFDTDAEFLQWLAENCPDDFGYLAEEGEQMFSAFKGALTSSTPAPAGNNTLALKLSPNPASEVFEVRTDGGALIGRVELTDFNGKILAVQSNVAADRVSIPVSELPQGIYLVKVSAENGATSTRKLVKQ